MREEDTRLAGKLKRRQLGDEDAMLQGSSGSPQVTFVDVGPRVPSEAAARFSSLGPETSDNLKNEPLLFKPGIILHVLLRNYRESRGEAGLGTLQRSPAPSADRTTARCVRPGKVTAVSSSARCRRKSPPSADCGVNEGRRPELEWKRGRCGGAVSERVGGGRKSPVEVGKAQFYSHINLCCQHGTPPPSSSSSSSFVSALRQKALDFPPSPMPFRYLPVFQSLDPPFSP